MGLETAALFALTAASAIGQESNANKQAKSITQAASQDALTSAQATVQKESKAKVSFLQSGFTLDGTPEMSLKGILNAGYQDVNNIAVNANSKSKNITAEARTKALMQLGQAGLSAGMGSSLGSSATFGTNSWNGLGQEVGSGFNNSAEGPFLPFGMK